MSAKKRYTSADIKLLTEAIQRYPDNATKAYEEVAKKLKTTPSAISGLWFRQQKKKNKPSVVGHPVVHPLMQKAPYTLPKGLEKSIALSVVDSVIPHLSSEEKKAAILKLIQAI